MTHRNAAQLRADFDRGFAQAVAEAAPAHTDFLALRIDDELHAVRLSEVSQLLPLTALTPLPGPLPALLGLVGLRGAVVPVYDLCLLLGGRASGSPHWLLLVQGEPPLALAFDGFEGHLRLPSTAHLRGAEGEQRRHVRELLNVGGSTRPVVSLASLRESIASLARPPESTSGRRA